MAAQQTPDLDGFRAAQRRHVGNMGHDATFFLPGAQTYPAGTPLDPQTGEPYDPRVEPEGTTAAEVVKRVNVIQRPVGQRGLEDPVVASRIALMSAASVVLILLAEDYAEVETATHVRVFGERNKITLFQPDGIGEVHRYLVFCEHA